jgi:hypothetical protein
MMGKYDVGPFGFGVGALNEERRPGLQAIANRIIAEDPMLGYWDVLAKAKAEWHRSQRQHPSPACGRPD